MCDTVAVDKGERSAEEEGDDPDDWYTADEGMYDKRRGLVHTEGYIEGVEKAEKERKRKKGEEVKSATNLELQFDLYEVNE